MSLTKLRSSFRGLDQVPARVGGRRGGGEGDRVERVHRHGDHRGMAETQSRECRRALQGRESRGSAWIAAGSQLTVVRERRRQRRIKVRGSSTTRILSRNCVSAEAKLSEIFHLFIER